MPTPIEAYPFPLFIGDKHLGTIFLPPVAAQTIAENRIKEFMFLPQEASRLSQAWEPRGLPPPINVRTAALVPRPGGRVELFGATVEEIEKVPGFYFAPSLSYVREIIIKACSPGGAKEKSNA